MNLLAQAPREFFIRIEAQNPVVRCLAQGEVLLPDVPEPWLMNEPRVEITSDERRAVGASGINNNNLIYKVCRAPQASWEILLFVKRDNGEGDFHLFRSETTLSI